MTTWLQHVKKVHAAGNTSFKESLKRASASWKKQKGSGSEAAAAPKRKRGRKKKAAEDPISTDEPEAAAPKKKKRRRAKKATPDLPDKNYKSTDSRSLR